MPDSMVITATELPFGANVSVEGGVTFKVWAPNCTNVYVVGSFNSWTHDITSAMEKDDHGIWSSHVENAAAGDTYMFYVEDHERGIAQLVRDPFARELTYDKPAWPKSYCVIVDQEAYHWRAVGFTTPERSDIICYQLHVGCFWGPDRHNRTAVFLDIIDRIEHLANLGINAIQLLPIAEFNTSTSMGYNGVDQFSAEMDYEVDDDNLLRTYVNKANNLFRTKGFPPVTIEEVRGSYNQTKLLFDLLHAWGIAVICDVVYNHAGNPIDDQCIFNLDKPDPGRNASLYFCNNDHCGPVFDFSKPMVRDFLIKNALFYFDELHVDGLRFDQVSVIDYEGAPNGWNFCQAMTTTILAHYPKAILNAEYWGVNPWVVKPVKDGGAGFNSTQHDRIRISVRAAVKQASYGMAATVSMDAIADALHHRDFSADQIFTCICNHDIVYAGDGADRGDRIPTLADSHNAWSTYACGRARVAHGILMTAPGIPMLFMGQEMLETKRWHDSRQEQFLLWWDGLDHGVRTVTDFYQFMKELISLRKNYRALRDGSVDTYYVHNIDRILAFRRSLAGEPEIVVVISFNDAVLYHYEIGFPQQGEWNEIFNSNVFDNWVNRNVHGNGGRIQVDGPSRQGLCSSARIIIPANSILVFSKE
ncbi:MAG: 1,4-alpha-glucan branching protein [Fibrobacter sp.]|nr:1,4-alpha-glucan branching protein [Fibrobacter sp.]